MIYLLDRSWWGIRGVRRARHGDKNLHQIQIKFDLINTESESNFLAVFSVVVMKYIPEMEIPRHSVNYS